MTREYPGLCPFSSPRPADASCSVSNRRDGEGEEAREALSRASDAELNVCSTTARGMWCGSCGRNRYLAGNHDMIQRLECSVGEEGDSHANTGTPASTSAEADSDATPSRAQARRQGHTEHFPDNFEPYKPC